MKPNITFVISNINKALAFEWLATYLDKEKFNTNFILLYSSDSELEHFLIQHKIPVDRITFTGKKDIPKAIYLTYKLLKKYKTNIVHTHLFEANIVGLTAAWLAGISKRIHTRHHSNYHHAFYPKAVKYDKLVNFLSTDIVAITEVVKNVLMKQEGVKAKKIHLIHHGFLLENFASVSESTVNKLKDKFNPGNLSPVIGVISRFTEWKGVQFIIPAFKKLLNDYPDALLLLAHPEGNYKTEIQKLLQTLPQKNYLEVPFESNLFALYKLFDVFVHVPINKSIEAFGQTYVEALASGIPSVFTLSGIANEFIVHEENALVVDYKNSEAIYNAIMRLLKDNALRENLIRSGKASVQEKFALENMINGLEKLYLSK